MSFPSISNRPRRHGTALAPPDRNAHHQAHVVLARRSISVEPYTGRRPVERCCLGPRHQRNAGSTPPAQPKPAQSRSPGSHCAELRQSTAVDSEAGSTAVDSEAPAPLRVNCRSRGGRGCGPESRTPGWESASCRPVSFPTPAGPVCRSRGGVERHEPWRTQSIARKLGDANSPGCDSDVPP